jgi:DNA recombination protein RmuC
MVLIVALVALALSAVLAVAAATALRRAVSRAVEAERADALAAAQQVMAAENQQAMQSAIDTLLLVAGEKFADHSAAASQQLDLRTDAMGQQFEQMRAELEATRDLVGQLRRERAEQQGRFDEGLAEAVRASTMLSSTTQHLREALASTKARGQWGERMADDVLRAAGFVEGINYRKQTGVASGGVPDFTFVLPNQRVLHMDVKFPLDNYLRALDASTEPERERFEVAFLKDVRQRVKEISGRGYIDPDETVEAVLLFLPNESIYGWIHEHDSALIDLALSQRVVLCSPFTLFAVLAVVRQAVDAFMVERTGDQILEVLGGFTAQWEKFSEAVDTLGKRLESTQKAFDDVAGTRRRVLQRHLDKVDDLRSQRGVALPDLDVVTAGAVAGRPAHDLGEGDLHSEDDDPDDLGRVAAGGGAVEQLPPPPSPGHGPRLRSIRLK